MQVGLEGNNLGVFLQHAIGMQLLIPLIACDTDIDTIAQPNPGALIFGFVA